MLKPFISIMMPSVLTASRSRVSMATVESTRIEFLILNLSCAVWFVDIIRKVKVASYNGLFEAQRIVHSSLR